jgi:hypothetical protein
VLDPQGKKEKCQDARLLYQVKNNRTIRFLYQIKNNRAIKGLNNVLAILFYLYK